MFNGCYATFDNGLRRSRPATHSPNPAPDAPPKPQKVASHPHCRVLRGSNGKGYPAANRQRSGVSRQRGRGNVSGKKH